MTDAPPADPARSPRARPRVRASGDSRRLLPVDVPPGEAAVRALLAPLQSALRGDGPAVWPRDPGDAAGASAAIRPDLALEADGIAAVLATSGSTGEPKGVLLGAESLLFSARATLDRLGGPGQWTLALPLSRVAGLQVLVRSLLAGAPPVAVEAGPVGVGFRVEAFTAASRRLDPATRSYTALVPTQLRRLLGAGAAALAALRSYDAVLLGGGPADGGLLDRARRERVPVVTTYGMTETCGGCVYDGLPLDGVALAVDPAGRVRVGGPVVFAGYRLRPELTAAALVDGWHVTCDLGHLDAAGRLVVEGRADDVAVSGGVNVPLGAVERCLAAHPTVREVAVVAVADPEWGQRLVAFVVPDGPAPQLAQLRAHVSQSYPRSFGPRQVVVVDALPLLASGKPDRMLLSRRAAGDATERGPAG
jgi:o-succinylbenzoate---CoA ligase